MCGIYVHVGDGTQPDLKASVDTLKHRGPDDSKYQWITPSLFFGFHRLSIVGLDHANDEPLRAGYCVLVCNGSIYNYKELYAKYQFQAVTKNDCEIIIHLYQRFGLPIALSMLRGSFAFALYDTMLERLWVANDPIGIRPLFWAYGGDKTHLTFASEAIALKRTAQMQWFQPGTYMEIFFDKGTFSGFRQRVYWDVDWIPKSMETPETHAQELCFLLQQAVQRRLYGDVPMCSLLSGGLDSSLVASIASRELKKRGQVLHTFTIGLDESPDILAARTVAAMIGSEHHELLVTETEMLDCIDDVIRAIQSYDTTTIRASVPNYLLGKYIRNHTQFRAVLNGDCSEEVFASYYYSRFAPSPEAFHDDNKKLLREVHRYDVLRSARCMEHFGLEARTPFSDVDFVEAAMAIPPEQKMVTNEHPMEKYLLRKAFDNGMWLPREILWRQKEAFSDGVSNKGRSWHKILYEHYHPDHECTIFGDLDQAAAPCTHTPETMHNYHVYANLFNGRKDAWRLFPALWMPRFVDGVTDPSARELQGIRPAWPCPWRKEIKSTD